MLRNLSLAGLVVVAAALTSPLVGPARAQLGNIFRDDPPRPPRGMIQQDDEEEEVPELPQGRLLPAPNRPLPGTNQGNLGAPPPGRYQSQPLPPPPGTTVIPQNAPTAIAPPSAAPPPVANTPPAPAQRGKTAVVPPAPASLQPGDEVVSEPPAQKIVNKKATFNGLDKITGRIIAFDADIGETVQFGALRVKPDACYTRPATEAANTDAFVEVEEITLQGEVKRIFSGWMFAASPGLHGIEHPIYDVWLTDCKGPATTVVTAQPDPKPAPVAVQKRAPPRQAPRPAPPPQQPPQQNGFFPPFGR